MRILFIGNSHTFFHGMPFQCREMLGHLGVDAEVTMIAQPGETLLWHAGNPATKLALRYDAWDYIILQQATHPFAGAEPLCNGISQLLSPLLRSHPSALRPQIGLFQTWCEKEKQENQAAIDQAFQHAAQTFNLPVIPVSDAWHGIEARDPGHDLYHIDGEHAGRAGSYVTALCMTRALTGQSVIGLPSTLAYHNTILNRVSPPSAALYQTVVDEVIKTSINDA